MGHSLSVCRHNTREKWLLLTIQLQQVCQNLGFTVYIGCVWREVQGGCDEHRVVPGGRHKLYDVCSDEIMVKRAIDWDGTEIACDTPITLSISSSRSRSLETRIAKTTQALQGMKAFQQHIFIVER